MATAAITQNGRIWREYRAYLEGTSSVASVVNQYREHNVSVVKTVGYTTSAAAISAAALAAGDGIVASYEREGVMYSVTVETDTTGDWTTFTP